VGGYRKDEHGRILPGSVQGWGASWWFYEQGIGPEELSRMPDSGPVQMLCRYFEAVRSGWEPPVPREQWVGPHHPWKSETSVGPAAFRPTPKPAR
jgi:hypothetical protein